MDLSEGKWQTLSIIVLTYNRKQLLVGCLDSLFCQTYPREKLEIIVVDDGSSDGTSELVNKLANSHRHLKYVYQSHKGIPAARNNGIKHAAGAIIAIVADDYLLPPNYSETIANFFHDYPQAKVVRFRMVSAGHDFFSQACHLYYEVSIRNRLRFEEGPGSGSLGTRFKRSFLKIQLPEEKITTQHTLEAAGAAAFRREVFDEVGFFDEGLRRGEDSDMTLRMKKKGILVYYNPYLCFQHRYGSSLFGMVKKNFYTGIYRYQFRKRYQRKHVPFFPKIVNYIGGLILIPVWRARQADSFLNFFLYLPFMYLFELALFCGLFSGFLMSRLGRYKSFDRSFVKGHK